MRVTTDTRVVGNRAELDDLFSALPRSETRRDRSNFCHRLDVFLEGSSTTHFIEVIVKFRWPCWDRGRNSAAKFRAGFRFSSPCSKFTIPSRGIRIVVNSCSRRASRNAYKSSLDDRKIYRCIIQGLGGEIYAALAVNKSRVPRSWKYEVNNFCTTLIVNFLLPLEQDISRKVSKKIKIVRSLHWNFKKKIYIFRNERGRKAHPLAFFRLVSKRKSGAGEGTGGGHWNLTVISNVR